MPGVIALGCDFGKGRPMIKGDYWVQVRGGTKRAKLQATEADCALTVEDLGLGVWWWVVQGPGGTFDGKAATESEACLACMDVVNSTSRAEFPTVAESTPYHPLQRWCVCGGRMFHEEVKKPMGDGYVSRVFCETRGNVGQTKGCGEPIYRGYAETPAGAFWDALGKAERGEP